MNEPLSDLEKYIRGLPLTDEHAALMEGREPVAEIWRRETQEKTQAEITEEDREWLRRLKYEPGFAIFLRLLNSTVQKLQDGAILLSTLDPLGNKDEILNRWVYVACMKTALADIHAILHDL